MALSVPGAATSPRPTRSVPNPAAPRRTRKAPSFDTLPVLTLIVVPIALTVWGWSYYSSSPGARLRHPLHDLLRPAGAVGLALGIVGLALFLFLWLYPLRKTVRWLAWTGAIGSWLRVHIVAGLAVPVIVAVHAGWRFDGLIGLGYWAMFTVALSGIVGRYLYTHIPRTRGGLEMSLDEIGGERRALVTEIAADTGLAPMEVERALTLDVRSYAGLDPLRTVLRLVQDDWQRGRTLAQLRRMWSRPRPGRTAIDTRALARALRLARHEMRLAQQVRMLDATRRLFGWWHVAHRPFALTALLAVLIHVGVAIAVGGVGFGGGLAR